MNPRQLVCAALVAAVPLAALVPLADAGGKRRRGPVSYLQTKYGAVRIFPHDNPWNTEIVRAKVHPDSAALIASIGADETLHADFGTTWQGAPNGIPYVVVGPRQPKVKVAFKYRDESDRGPYPIPPDAPIEGGPAGKGDRHVIVVSPTERKLYELFHAYKQDDGTWKAGSGAIFDLTSNKLRPWGYTSADAAGLPIFPGLVRYGEVERGVIPHALRITVQRSRKAYIPPATHHAGRSDDENLPPMGLRLRLKPTVEAKKFPKQARPIVVAMQRYGVIVADNGSDWYVSGAPDERWSDDQLRALKKIKGSDFEVVWTGKARK